MVEGDVSHLVEVNTAAAAVAAAADVAEAAAAAVAAQQHQQQQQHHHHAHQAQHHVHAQQPQQAQGHAQQVDENGGVGGGGAGGQTLKWSHPTIPRLAVQDSPLQEGLVVVRFSNPCDSLMATRSKIKDEVLEMLMLANFVGVNRGDKRRKQSLLDDEARALLSKVNMSPEVAREIDSYSHWVVRIMCDHGGKRRPRITDPALGKKTRIRSSKKVDCPAVVNFDLTIFTADGKSSLLAAAAENDGSAAQKKAGADDDRTWDNEVGRPIVSVLKFTRVVLEHQGHAEKITQVRKNTVAYRVAKREGGELSEALMTKKQRRKLARGEVGVGGGAESGAGGGDHTARYDAVMREAKELAAMVEHHPIATNRAVAEIRRIWLDLMSQLPQVPAGATNERALVADGGVEPSNPAEDDHAAFRERA